MASPVHIVTDSASDISLELAAKSGIKVVPLTVRFGDEEFADQTELSIDAFWSRVRSDPVLPSTAAPSPGQFAEAFRDGAEKGKSAVVCICISSKLSATYQNASIGAELVRDAIEVRVVDSQLCTIAQGTLALEANRVAGDGGSIIDVVDAVDYMQPRLRLYGALDTLDHLRKGGRIGAAGAFFGSLLSVKPIIRIEDGQVKAESRQRTRSRALSYLAEKVKAHAPASHVTVGHCGAPDLDHFVGLLGSVGLTDTITITDIGPVIATHGGPRTIAVSCVVSR